ncbi:unnamed protein product [Soboliphyme baturini]|uniref:Cadherin_C domain-containing protein n=1 Tax=Soboliphyme baturini TaxID=241478 RepID=A0A183J3D3_9BILA|nr:unnamed protein product [Soboliphyme baturini]
MYAMISIDGFPESFTLADQSKVREPFVLFNIDPQSVFVGSYKTTLSVQGYQGKRYRDRPPVSFVKQHATHLTGCISDFWFNDYWMPLERNDSVVYATISKLENIGNQCPLLSTCEKLPNLCSPPFICVDFWKGPFCTCPDFRSAFIENGKLVGCGGSLAALHLGITGGAVAAIIVTLVSLIFLVLFFVIYSQRRRSTPYTSPDDDIRENIMHYNEEGGGEEDQDAYNIAALRKPVLPIEDNALKLPNGDAKRKPVHPDDLDAFIRDRLQDADQDPDVPPLDELRLYVNEDDTESVGSLSSLSSDESDIDWEEVNRWDQRFKNLADMYREPKE